MSTPAAAPVPAERLSLHWRPFSFRLPLPLVTASGRLETRRGWLLRLESPDGRLGWGEAAPLDPAAHPAVAACLDALAPSVGRADLERALPKLPPTVAFALGAALAEIDGEVGPGGGGWLAAPRSAWLLPAGQAMIQALGRLPAGGGPGAEPLTLKWKVAVAADALERQLLERLLAWHRRLYPRGYRRALRH